MSRHIVWLGSGLLLIVLSLASQLEVRAVDAVDEGCPKTSAPTDHQGNTLQGFATSGSSGVVYDDADEGLKLSRQGGVFKAVTVGISDSHNVSCAADFDEDGWTDMVVGQSHNRFIYYYRNRTFENPAPDWSDTSAIRTPKFTLTHTIETALATGTEHAGMVCGDYDGDGHQDFFYYKAANENAAPNIQRLYLGKGNGTFHTPTAPLVTPSQLPYFGQTSTNAIAYDYNGDGWLDILYGGKKASSATSGCVVALLNNCPTPHQPGTACASVPQFTVADVKTTVVLTALFGVVAALTLGPLARRLAVELSGSRAAPSRFDDLHPGWAIGIDGVLIALVAIIAATVIRRARRIEPI